MSALLPTPYAVLLYAAPIVVVASVIWIIVAERKHGSRWAATLPWCAIAIVVPLIGLILWSIWHYSIRPSVAKRNGGEAAASEDR